MRLWYALKGIFPLRFSTHQYIRQLSAFFRRERKPFWLGLALHDVEAAKEADPL